MSKRVIDLSGPDGNAFVLLGLARGWAKELGLDYQRISAEMKSGDYENLVAVFQTYFGPYIKLVKVKRRTLGQRRV